MECAVADSQGAVLFATGIAGIVRIRTARAVRRIDRAAGRTVWHSILRLALFQRELGVRIVEHAGRCDDLALLVDNAARLLLAAIGKIHRDVLEKRKKG